MAKENETIADIIAEMRSDANADEYTPDGILGQKLNYIADRIEAAWGRETQAHKKELETRDAVIQTEVAAREAEREAHKREMKETVRLVSRVAEEMTRGTAKGVAPTRKEVDEWAVRLYDIIDITLLAAPPRNCDVHTADELKAMFNSELVSELPIANEHEKNLVSITAMGVIDTLFATATEKEGGEK